MLETDPRVADALDEIVPRYDGEPGDWDWVVRAASRRRIPPAVLAFVTAVAAAVGLALAWPSGDGPGGGVLDRALAAAGEGPVTHALFRESTGETQEVWYHPERGVVRSVDGSPARYHPPRDEDPAAFAVVVRVAFLGDRYRESLKSGRARVLGGGAVEGTPVHWIFAGAIWTFAPEQHVWEFEVAVSRQSYEPVAVRARRDGEPWAGGTARIVRFETLPEEAFPRPSDGRGLPSG